MVFPSMGPWVEEGEYRSRIGLDYLDAIRLAKIAAGTSPGKILEFGGAASGLRHNMFKVKASSLQ
jgi:hypothetical protein